MKRFTSIALMAILLLSCIACQPTPEEEIVYNRGDGKLEQAIVATAAPTFAPEEAYEAPPKWEETLDVRGRTVQIDAEIVMPETNSFPVVTITQEDFTEEEAVAFFKTMLGDTVEIREQVRSYDELLEDLMLAERGHYRGEDDDTGEILYGPYAGQEKEIAELKEQLTQVGTEETYKPLGSEFPVGELFALKDENGKKWYGRYTGDGVEFMDSRRGLVQLENWVMQGDAIPGEKKHALENITITLEEAKEIGDALVEKMNAGNFFLALYDKARMIEGKGSYATAGEGYYLTYVRDIGGGVPLFYDYYTRPSCMKLEHNENCYSPGWQQEHIEIFVTEKGVHFFAWADKKTVVNTANENVQLMPFDEIQDSIRKLITYSLADELISAGKPVEDTVLVTKMVLSTSIQQVADQGEEAFMAPTWIVFMTTEKEQRLNFDTGVILISAIDGGVVWK